MQELTEHLQKLLNESKSLNSFFDGQEASWRDGYEQGLETALELTQKLLDREREEAIGFADFISSNEWKKNWRHDKKDYQWQQFDLHSNPKRDYKTTSELYEIYNQQTKK